jgi:hypothetical protein
VENWQCKLYNFGFATLLASYPAKFKRFIAHFSYIACDQQERVTFKIEARTSMSEATLVYAQTHRDKTLSIDAVIDRFTIKTTSSSRRFILAIWKPTLNTTVAHTHLVQELLAYVCAFPCMSFGLTLASLL